MRNTIPAQRIMTPETFQTSNGLITMWPRGAFAYDFEDRDENHIARVLIESAGAQSLYRVLGFNERCDRLDECAEIVSRYVQGYETVDGSLQPRHATGQYCDCIDCTD